MRKDVGEEEGVEPVQPLQHAFIFGCGHLSSLVLNRMRRSSSTTAIGGGSLLFARPAPSPSSWLLCHRYVGLPKPSQHLKLVRIAHHRSAA
jgi:hypothetical protein